MERVVVIGAGISGLAAAHTLLDAARRRGLALDLQVLEAHARAGGHALTVRENGFLVEAGPNGFLDREPGPLELASELGIEAKLVEARAAAKRRFIVRGRRLRRVPDAPPTMLTSDALSPWGKLRLLMEPWARAAPEGAEETVFEFARRRIGAEAAEQLVDAAISGISAGDSKELSVAAAFPLMLEMEREHGSLIRAMMARKGKKTRIMSFDGGLATLVDALAQSLAGRVRTGARVRNIARAGNAWRITLAPGAERSAGPAENRADAVVDPAAGTIVADHVVLATPAHASAEILAPLDDALSRQLSAFPFAGLSLVALAFRKADVPRALDGYGYLVTRGEGLRTLGVVWESSLFEGRAPSDAVLLRAFLGGRRAPHVVELSEPDVVAMARRELAPLMGISARPMQSWTFRFPQSIAQYTLGARERTAQVRALAARHPGLHLVGTSYDGISFSSAITEARRFATRWVESCDRGASRSTPATPSAAISQAVPEPQPHEMEPSR